MKKIISLFIFVIIFTSSSLKASEDFFIDIDYNNDTISIETQYEDFVLLDYEMDKYKICNNDDNLISYHIQSLNQDKDIYFIVYDC